MTNSITWQVIFQDIERKNLTRAESWVSDHRSGLLFNASPHTATACQPFIHQPLLTTGNSPPRLSLCSFAARQTAVVVLYTGYTSPTGVWSFSQQHDWNYTFKICIKIIKNYWHSGNKLCRFLSRIEANSKRKQSSIRLRKRPARR